MYKILLCCMLYVFVSCKDKSPSYYKNEYLINKSEYIETKSRLDEILNSDSTLVELELIFTGKRLILTAYRSKSNIHDIAIVKVPELLEDRFSRFMYERSIYSINNNKDSTEFTYSGIYKNRILIYSHADALKKGFLIDSNTYFNYEKINEEG